MLAQEDLKYIRQQFTDWIVEESIGKPAVVYEIELRERIIRVEEELKHQRELMLESFRQMDKRFEQVDKRFEQVDKRFEQMERYMKQRFEQVDKRFEQMDKRFEALNKRMDRFMVWSFSTTVTVGGLIVAILKFWQP